MPAVLQPQAQLIAKPMAPPIVYFWGPTRAHVNRVALEYAARLAPSPVCLEVRETDARAEAPLDPTSIPNVRTFVLRAGKDVQLVSAGSAQPEPADVALTPDELDEQVGTVLEFPPVVRSALQATNGRGPRSPFVLTNIDRLKHLYPMFEHGMADALLRSFRQKGIILILTSEGLLRLPQLPYECAFEVSSSPEDKWWEAEVRPGVPVSCCGECPGSVAGEYASCTPEFRLACPVLVPFEAEAT